MAGLRQKYRTLVELAPDPIFLLDPADGTVREVNDRAADILGYDVDTLEGMDVSELHPAEAAAAYRRLFERTIDAGELRAETLEDGNQICLVTADGEAVPVELHAKTIEVGDGRLLYTIARDIGDRYDRERRLKRQRDRQEAFAAVVSHDLRNPLSVATSRLELARETHETEHLDHALDALDRMDSLIADLLELARHGDRVGTVSSVPLAAVCTDAWRSVETAGAELSVAVEGTVAADRDRLQQLFENLFGNAVTHGGTAVTVTVGRLRDGFYVADDGVGIPEPDRETVFDAGHTTSDHGTGLGLRIVERIVEAHGWSIDLTEGQSGGARFEITGVDGEV